MTVSNSLIIPAPFLSLASPLLGSPLGRSRHSSSQSDLTGGPSNSSGLSFTACMSDFSLYVFHPYGAGKQKSAVTGLPPGPSPLGNEYDDDGNNNNNRFYLRSTSKNNIKCETYRLKIRKYSNLVFNTSIRILPISLFGVGVSVLDFGSRGLFYKCCCRKHGKKIGN